MPSTKVLTVIAATLILVSAGVGAFYFANQNNLLGQSSTSSYVSRFQIQNATVSGSFGAGNSVSASVLTETTTVTTTLIQNATVSDSFGVNNSAGLTVTKTEIVTVTQTITQVSTVTTTYTLTANTVSNPPPIQNTVTFSCSGCKPFLITSPEIVHADFYYLIQAGGASYSGYRNLTQSFEFPQGTQVSYLIAAVNPQAVFALTVGSQSTQLTLFPTSFPLENGTMISGYGAQGVVQFT